MFVRCKKDIFAELPHDGLKSVIMFSSIRLNKPFATIMEKLRKLNPKLLTERWKLLKLGSHQWKMLIEVDTSSLVELERLKRTIIDGDSVYKFTIRYLHSL